MTAADPAMALARLRALALALPGSAEKLSHGAPMFHAGKAFAWFFHDHHGDGLTKVCVKTSGREEQDLLIEANPDLYSWPAYIGPSGWIAINVGGRDPDWAHGAERVERSWRMIAPKRLLVLLPTEND